MGCNRRDYPPFEEEPRPFWVVEVKVNADDPWKPIEHAFPTKREAESYGIQWWGADDHRADYRVVRVA